MLAQQISQIQGVAQVLIYGSQRFAIRVQVDPVAAAARNISLDEIRNAVSRGEFQRAGRHAGRRAAEHHAAASGAMTKAADYKQITVAYRNGVSVKLEEVARVLDSVENDKVASWFNDERAIVLAIQRQPDANTVAVVDAVRERLPAFRAQVPAAIEMQFLLDRSLSIRDSVAEVQFHLTISVALVVLVIFLFLRKASATIIPSLAVPVSLIGTFAAMYAFGFSINNMTLLALALSVGFVVDDAIVMLENIARHIEGGMRPFEAALKGSREVGFTIISITFSLIAVFIPVLLMGGMVGRVFREFAVTISVAIVVSGFVSLTLTPMLCARVLKVHHENEKQMFILRWFEAMFRSWLRAYEWSLDWVIKYKAIMLVVTFATLGGSVWLYMVIPKGFFPPEDTGYIASPPRGRATSVSRRCRSCSARSPTIIRQDPAVEYLNSTVGTGGPNPTSNYGRMLLGLKPMSGAQGELDRGDPAAAPHRQHGAGRRGLLPEHPEHPRGGAHFQERVPVHAAIQRHRGALPDRAGAAGRGREDRRAARRHHRPLHQESGDGRRGRPREGGGLRHHRRSDPPGALQRVRLAPDRHHLHAVERLPDHHAEHAGVPDRPDGALQDLPQDPRGQSAAGAVGGGASGTGVLTGPSIPLSAVTRLVPSVGPLQVNHQGQQPAVTISFNLAPGVSLGYAVDQIQRIEREAGLPASITTGFQGSAQVFQESLKGQGILVLAAIFAAYVVLGILYESFIHPITIISGLPSAGIGALLTLMLFKMDLSVIAMIGIVMLVGIVKKNAIMMIDFAIERRRVGLGAEAAIREAALLRFRPIMMTTFAAIFGALPIAIGSGAGAELRQPLGVAVVGGLLLSQLLTLYITPVVYLYLDRIDRRIKRRLEPQLEEVPEPIKPAVAAE